MARISVIVPCYNASAFLEKTIESVLAQDTQDWELILVDDGSTDATPEIIERHCSQDARMRGVRQQNAGRACACNLGAARIAPDAQYLFFLDSDDQLVPGALRLMSNYLDTHPEVCLLGCQFQEVDPEGRPYGTAKRSRWVPGFFLPRQLSDDERETPFVTFFCATGQGPFAMYRRSVFQATTGWEKKLSCFSAQEDSDMFCQMALLGKVHYLPDRFYLKRVHGTSITQQCDRVQNAYTVFRQKWDQFQSEDPKKAELLRNAKRHYQTRHRPFRDLKVALRELPAFFRKPSLGHIRWTLFLLKSGIKGLFSRERF
ncbi:MAG: glycosyltransferase family 2 protein [Verrucomicrobia bacterium]|nr:glycosyltransferase family 2 protein [Verrucomicrobiota bacterium]